MTSRRALTRAGSALVQVLPVSVAVCFLAVACGGGAPPVATAPPPSAPPPPVVVTDPNAVDRAALPEPGPAPVWSPPQVSEVQLSNGAKLWYLKQGKTPLMNVQLLIPHGAATDPVGKEGLTQLTTDLLDEGAGKLGALALNEALQRLATDYGGSASTDSIDLGMSLLASNFAASMDILADILMRPKLTQADFSRRRDQLVSQAIADEKKPDVGRINVLRSVLFGEGYGSYSAGGDRVSLKRISLADVKRQHKALFSPEGATFVVVGDMELDRVKEHLERAFASWTSEPSAKPRALEAEAVQGGIHLVDYPKATQSALAIAVRADASDTKDYFPEEVFNWSLGGAFTSRLNLNLREEKGYTYGARSDFVRWRQAGFYWLAAKVKSETTRPSIDEMLKEVRDVCASRPLTSKERGEAVNGMLLGFPSNFESVGGTAMQLVGARMDGRSSDWFSTWFSSMEKVSLDAAQSSAKRYCNPDAYVVIIAGDREQVEPTLQGLDRPLSTYDALGNRLSAAPAAKAAPKK